MTAPCKDCDRRVPGCHSMCKDYQGWKKVQEIGAAERQRERDAATILCRNVQRQIWRYMKQRRP